MKLKLVLGWSSALCLSACALQAQETKSLDEVQKQLQQMKQAFDKLMQEQQKKIEELSRQLEELKKGQGAQRTNPPASMVPGNATQAGLEKKPWSMTDPIRIGNAQNYLNISFDGLFAVGTSTAKDIEELETGGHDPKQRGFTVENVETTFEGKVDPYFRAQAAVVLQIDPQGESFIELEEAYADSMSLPANLQLRAGQFFTEFGRQNQTHPHAWDFVDQPLVMGRFLG